MSQITFSQYKMDVINTITDNMFKDKKHYCYYSELLVNVLLSSEYCNFKPSCPSAKKIGLIKKDKEHLKVLKREFSETIELIENN